MSLCVCVCVCVCLCVYVRVRLLYFAVAKQRLIAAEMQSHVGILKFIIKVVCCLDDVFVLLSGPVIIHTRIEFFALVWLRLPVEIAVILYVGLCDSTSVSSCC